jgi:hypothetical protein
MPSQPAAIVARTSPVSGTRAPGGCACSSKRGLDTDRSVGGRPRIPCGERQTFSSMMACFKRLAQPIRQGAPTAVRLIRVR